MAGSKCERLMKDIERDKKVVVDAMKRLDGISDPAQILKTINSVQGQLVSMRADCKNAIIAAAMGD